MMGSDVFIHFLAPWRKPLSQTQVILTFVLDISPITGRDESVKGRWDAFIKLHWSLECQGERPSEDIQVVGKWSRVSPAIFYTVTCRPVKQAWSGHARRLWWRNSALSHIALHHLKFYLVITHPNGVKSMQSMLHSSNRIFQFSNRSRNILLNLNRTNTSVLTCGDKIEILRDSQPSTRFY